MGVRLPRLSKPGLRIERVRRPRGAQERGMGWSATGNRAVLCCGLSAALSDLRQMRRFM